MPRVPRMVRTDPGHSSLYHIISRTALDGLPFKNAEKDELVRVIKRFSLVFAVDVHGYAIMGNHFHLLVEMHPASSLSDDEVRRRYRLLYSKSEMFPEGLLEHYRERFSSLSSYVKEIKQRFSCHYNKRHNRRGTLWGERFKSVLVEHGHTMMNCLAYIDLNPVRAGIVKKPEDYRWSSIGYHLRTENRDGFLSEDFGLADFENETLKDERLREYRDFLYHAGAISKEGKAKISDAVLREAKRDDFYVSRAKRFRLRTRYFTDSGAIGTKAFVEGVFLQFKDRYDWKRVRIPKRVGGVEGVYSLKRLSEMR